MDSMMRGQIQVSKVKDPYRAGFSVLMKKEKLIEKANKQDPILISHGGGVKEVTARVTPGPDKILLIELHIDCKDAMGANVVNTMAEAVAPLIEEITGGNVLLRIVSNLCVERLARASVMVNKDVLGGGELVDGIVGAYRLAASDIFRCATHNKGTMNGIIAVALATGNDTRALEAGAHAYASLGCGYKPLTIWEKTKQGHLAGTIELPLAVGVIGGATTSHPLAKISRKILGVKTAKEFAEVLSAVGLAQNFAALRALVGEGIQRGHMKLHARNIAAMAGAEGSLIDEIAKKMVAEKNIRLDRAEDLLRNIK
jgi:hydroxymethylglutaryl-CoA reductase